MIRYPYILWAATLQHIVWLILLSISEAPIHTAPMSALAFLGRPGAVIVLLVSVVGSLFGLGYWHPMLNKFPTINPAFLLLPQQMILTASALTACVLIYQGHYADGVIRPSTFIAADQVGGIVIAICHTTAIIRTFRKK